MKEAYIIDGLRTAFGKFRGSLSTIRTDDLLAHVLKNLTSQNENIPLDAYEDVIIGCANQAGEDNRNVARMSLLLAGLPWSVPGETINRLCSSGMLEHMTRAPLVMSKSARPYGGDMKVYDSSFGWRFVNPRMKALYGIEAMGNTAENLAELYNINRADQDAFALWSQQKASLNDGAAAVIVASEDAVKQYNLKPLARIVSSAVVGVEPRIMGIGPVKAGEKALAKAGLSLKDIGVIELNEAFSAQALACTRKLGLADDDARINPNGGAIAIGHPLGVSGTRS